MLPLVWKPVTPLMIAAPVDNPCGDWVVTVHTLPVAAFVMLEIVIGPVAIELPTMTYPLTTFAFLALGYVILKLTILVEETVIAVTTYVISGIAAVLYKPVI